MKTKKEFREIIYDDTKNVMEVIGASIDDTFLINNVITMQKAGMKVRCSTGDIKMPKERILPPSGYAIENNLYTRLLTEYNLRTGKQLKRWS